MVFFLIILIKKYQNFFKYLLFKNKKYLYKSFLEKQNKFYYNYKYNSFLLTQQLVTEFLLFLNRLILLKMTYFYSKECKKQQSVARKKMHSDY